MQTTTLEFLHNARRTYTAVKHLFEQKRPQFSGVSFNDDLFVVEARHGAWLSPFSEKVNHIAFSYFQTPIVQVE